MSAMEIGRNDECNAREVAASAAATPSNPRMETTRAGDLSMDMRRD